MDSKIHNKYNNPQSHQNHQFTLQQMVVAPASQIPRYPDPQPVPPAPIAMNWSYFKPEFTAKPDDNQEAHLPSAIDWMDAHNFAADQRVRKFSITLTGKAKLWYQSIHSF